MHSQQCLINYLYNNPSETIAVRYSDSRTLAFKAPANELKVLAHHHMVEAHWNRSGRLKSVLLLVSVIAARRAIKDGRIPPLASKIITKRRSRRSEMWPPRFDRAKSGQMGRVVRTVITGPDTLATLRHHG